ncbi:hypothetical protein ACUVMQ_00695 [Aeromonas veronii]|uniref:hypothetical protein n=1 Tax=Aeromonas veronii TaxID=654 RepID=UPI0038D2ED4E
MTIESLLDTPYPQKQFRDLVFGAFIERQRRLFGEHVIVARMEGEEGLELSIDLSFVSTAVPVGLLAISEELALATAPRPKKSHPHYEALCKAIDCMVMLMFYGKVIRQRNTVLENIGHQFGYQPAATLTARVGKGGEDDYDAFMVNIMTCIAHSNSLKEALENASRMGIQEPAFFCIVGAIASTLWGVPRQWAYQASQLIHRSHHHYIQNLLRCETRAGRRHITLEPPKPPLFAPIRQQVVRLFKGAH